MQSGDVHPDLSVQSHTCELMSAEIHRSSMQIIPQFSILCYRNVLCRLPFTDSFVFYCIFIIVYRIDDVLIYSAAQLQECLINLLTYLLIYLQNYRVTSA